MPDKNFDVLPLSDIGLDPENVALMNDSQLSTRGSD
jgi:hypothetical protein